MLVITEIMIVTCTCLSGAVIKNVSSCSIKEPAVEQMLLCSDQTSNSCPIKINYIFKS